MISTPSQFCRVIKLNIYYTHEGLNSGNQSILFHEVIFMPLRIPLTDELLSSDYYDKWFEDDARRLYCEYDDRYRKSSKIVVAFWFQDDDEDEPIYCSDRIRIMTEEERRTGRALKESVFVRRFTSAIRAGIRNLHYNDHDMLEFVEGKKYQLTDISYCIRSDKSCGPRSCEYIECWLWFELLD